MPTFRISIVSAGRGNQLLRGGADRCFFSHLVCPTCPVVGFRFGAARYLLALFFILMMLSGKVGKVEVVVKLVKFVKLQELIILLLYLSIYF